jgi:SAM-dependent methyltransferase
MAMKFKESDHAHRLLGNLKGIEIGGAAHNPFSLNTINVDKFAMDSKEFQVYAQAQRDLCGEVMPVDVVAPGDKLPFKKKSYDFVISSHVIEHFYDPISALKEWCRVATDYIYIICPKRNALPSDVGRPLTTLDEHIARHAAKKKLTSDEHHSVWTPESFIAMCDHFGFKVTDHLPTDDKVGNGFTIVINIKLSNPI